MSSRNDFEQAVRWSYTEHPRVQSLVRSTIRMLKDLHQVPYHLPVRAILKYDRSDFVHVMYCGSQLHVPQFVTMWYKNPEGQIILTCYFDESGYGRNYKAHPDDLLIVSTHPIQKV